MCLLTSIKFQQLDNGDISGTIHRQRLIDEISKLPINENGCIVFIAQKWRKKNTGYSHMGPRINDTPTNGHTLSESPSRSYTLPEPQFNDHDLEKW